MLTTRHTLILHPNYNLSKEIFVLGGQRPYFFSFETYILNTWISAMAQSIYLHLKKPPNL